MAYFLFLHGFSTMTSSLTEPKLGVTTAPKTAVIKIGANAPHR